MPNYVKGQGPFSSPLMVVGEAPGAVEDESGIPFSGPSGQLLNEMLETAGVRRGEVYVTNVVKYKPPFNRLDNLGGIGISIDEQIPALWDEIHAIKPNCIVALGNLSLWALTGKGTRVRKTEKFSGITTYRGSILTALQGNYKVLPTIHPAALLRSQSEGVVQEKAVSYASRLYIQHDLNRAVEQSKFPDFRLPRRTLEVGRSAVDLWRFLTKYYTEQGLREVSVDIEVLHAMPVCIALAFNEWHAMSVPLLDIWKFQRKPSGISEGEFVNIWRVLGDFLSLPDLKVIGQNFKFDDSKLRRPCGMVVQNVAWDNMLAAHSLHCELEKSQAFLGSIYTEEPYYKDEGKEFDLKRSPVEQLLLYNAKDAAVAFEIKTAMHAAMTDFQVPGFPNWINEFFTDFVMRLHPLYRDMEDEGFAVDEVKRQSMLKDYDEKIKVGQKELNEIAGWSVNCNSPKQIGLLIYKDFGLPIRTGKGRGSRNAQGELKASTGEDVLIALQANVCKKAEHKRAIDLILSIRGWRKAKGTYIEAPCDFDGRMRTSIRICGTETGRTSNTTLKPPVRPFEMGLAFQTMSKHGEMGAELRKMFVADPGHVIMEFDQSQAEARVVALLGRSEETLELFNTTDIHKLTSTWIFSLGMHLITKEMRFIGKTCRHAGNYDMGKRRLMELVNTDAKKYGVNIAALSEWKAGQMLDAFHRFSPWIREVFHAEVVDALQNNNMMLVNPFGRARVFNGWWGDDLWREAYAQIPQSTVADHTKKCALRIKQRIPDVRMVVEAHDALVFMTPISQIEYHARIIKEEFETPIDFSRCTLQRGMLTIPCEAKIGENYKELKDFNLKEVA